MTSRKKTLIGLTAALALAAASNAVAGGWHSMSGYAGDGPSLGGWQCWWYDSNSNGLYDYNEGTYCCAGRPHYKEFEKEY